MNTAGPALAIIASGLIELWRIHAKKEPGWKPAPADWDELLKSNEKTAEDYEKPLSERDQ